MRTRMSGGVRRAVSNERHYQIYPAFHVTDIMFDGKRLAVFQRALRSSRGISDYTTARVKCDSVRVCRLDV